MKKIFLAIILIIFGMGTVFSQDTTSFYGKSQYIFQHVDRSQITSGLLSDYGIEFLNLSNYNGLLLADSNYVGLQEWRLLYSSLLSSQINSPANMIRLDTINNRVLRYIGIDKPISFAVMHYNYQSVRSDALSANLLTVSNDQLFDVPGRAQSPYQQHNVFAVAPIRQIAVMDTNYVIFRPELHFSNLGKTISEIAINIDSASSFVAVPLNTPYAISFSQPGFKNVVVRITYTDSSVYFAHTKLVVYPHPDDDTNNDLNATSPAQTFRFGNHRPRPVPEQVTATQSYLGVAASGDITVQLAIGNTTNQIRKPLIVIEGFDIDNSYDYDRFTRSMTFGLNNGLDDVEAYDLIFLNFSNATDYIQRNAYLLQRVIELVNARKTTFNGVRQENVVLGLSMGGLVARYALRKMEQNSSNHETRLFISHDSPHHGANVPVGMQAAVQHLAPFKVFYAGTNSDYPWLEIGWRDMFPDLIQPYDTFFSPAARQMLIQRYILNPFFYNLVADNSEHTAFYAELNNMGWPLSCKNLTLSNGSCNGTKIFPDGSRIFEMIGERSMSYGGQLWRSAAMTVIAPLSPGLVYGGNVNPLSLLIQFPLSLISTKSAVHLDFRINSVPNGGTSELYRGDIYIKRKLAWLFNSTSYIMKTRVNSLSGMLPLDNASGGLYDVEEFGMDASMIQNGLPKFFEGINAVVLQPRFCFIPTVSSLAISNPWQNLNSELCQTVNCLTPAAVSNYYAPQNNELHISYSLGSQNWIMQWQDKNFTCTKVCKNSFSITGPTPVNGNITYAVNNLPPGVTTSWQVNSPYSVVANPSVTNGTGLILPGYANNSFAQLAATINTGCNTFTIAKTLDPARITTTLTGGNGDPCGTGSASVNVPSGINFTWIPEGDVSIEGLPIGQPYQTTNNSVSIQGISGAISVRFQNFGNTVTLMEVYQPYVRSLSISGYLPLLPNDPLIVTLQDMDYNPVLLNWYLNEVLVQSGTDQMYASWDKGNVNCDYNDIRVEAVLECGTTTTIASTQFEQLCSGGWWRAMLVYPNPASSYINIGPDPEKQKSLSHAEKSKVKEYEAILYDSKGRMILKGRSSNLTLQMDTKKIKSGYYYLHIKVDGEKDVVKQQVIIRN